MEYQDLISTIVVSFLALLFSVIEIFIGFRERSDFFQTRFIIKNKFLKKLVIIKPMKDIVYGEQSIPISHFIVYILSVLNFLSVAICGIILWITKNDVLYTYLNEGIALFIAAINLTPVGLNFIITQLVNGVLHKKGK